MSDIPHEIELNIMAPEPTNPAPCESIEDLNYPVIGQALPQIGARHQMIAVMGDGLFQFRDPIAGFMNKQEYTLEPKLLKVEVPETVILDVAAFGEKGCYSVYDAYFPERPDLTFLQRFPQARTLFEGIKTLSFVKSKVIAKAKDIKTAKEELKTETGIMYGLPVLLVKPATTPFETENAARSKFIEYSL